MKTRWNENFCNCEIRRQWIIFHCLETWGICKQERDLTQVNKCDPIVLCITQSRTISWMPSYDLLVGKRELKLHSFWLVKQSAPLCNFFYNTQNLFLYYVHLISCLFFSQMLCIYAKKKYILKLLFKIKYMNWN